MADPADSPPVLTNTHRRRLREVWRSAGWPFQDLVEVELLAAGLLARQVDAAGRETLRVTDQGVAVLAQTLQKNRAVRDDHEQLVARVAREMQRAGRVVWRGLSLRAQVSLATSPEPGPTAPVAAEAPPAEPADMAPTQPPAPASTAWAMAMPDVYSIRHTTVEDYVEPIAHEIKVRRADLLSDLRRPTKGEAYRWLSGECWYVIREGIAQPQEIPEAYGVMLAPPQGPLVVARPAPRRPMRLPFAVWMALARAIPEPWDDDAQAPLLPLDNPDANPIA
jgi:hypothetical protein